MMYKYPTPALLIFALFLLLPTIAVSQDNYTPNDKNDLSSAVIDYITDLDRDTLEQTAGFIGIPFSRNDSKAVIVTRLIKFIRSNESLINEFNISGDPISVKLSTVNYDFVIRSDYNFTLRITDGDISYYQILFLNCEVDLPGFYFSADSVVINIYSEPGTLINTSDIEIMTGGNIRLKIIDYIFTAERLFIYPDTLQALLYDVRIYAPELLPFVLRADDVKMLSAEELIAYNVELGGSANPIFPHYRLTAGKLWIYPNLENLSINSFFASNVTFNVGQSSIFFLPFIFQSNFSTGVRAGIKYEQSIGFYIQTTTPFNIFGYSNAFVIDYFQKMGLYFSLSDDIRILDSMEISLSIAYDRAVRYTGKDKNHNGFLSNYVDINNDGKHTETFNSLRYFINLDFPYVIHEGNMYKPSDTLTITKQKSLIECIVSDNKHFNISELINNFIKNSKSGFNIEFMKISDPLFREQFIDFPRSTDFILTDDIIYREKNILIYTPEAPGNPSNAMTVFGSVFLKSDYLKINLSTNLLWAFKSKTGELNPYDVLNYYGLQLYSSTFPELNISYERAVSSDIIGDVISIFSENWSAVKNSCGIELELPLEVGISYNITSKTTYIKDNTDIKPNSQSDNIIEDAGEIQEQKDIEKLVIIHKTPLSFKFKFLNIDVNSEYQLERYFQHTKEKYGEPAEKLLYNDLEQTRYNWSWIVDSNLSLSFMKNYDYLSIITGVNIKYQKSGYFYDLLYQTGITDTKPIYDPVINNYGDVLKFENIYFSFLKTTFVLEGLNIPLLLTDEDYGELGTTIEFVNREGKKIKMLVNEKYLFEQKQSLYLDFTITNTIIKNLKIIMNYREKYRLDAEDYSNGGRDEARLLYGYPTLFGGKGESLKLILEYDSSDDLYIGNEIIIRDLKLNMEYTHYYGKNNYKQNKITLGIFIDADITKYWFLSFSYEISNRSIWRYFKSNDNPNPRNIFTDLLWSISVWDVEALQKTYWKINYMAVSINHDLDEWRLSLSIQLYPKIINGYLIFYPTIALSITLIDLPELSGGIEGDGKIDKFIFDRY